MANKRRTSESSSTIRILARPIRMARLCEIRAQPHVGMLSSAPPSASMNVKKKLLDAARMNRAIRRMAIEVVEKNRGIDDLIIVGIRSRGVPIGERMAKEISEMEGAVVPFGILDITLYRDDLTTIAPQPVVKPTKLPEPIDDKVVVLVDDVLYTGRTVRAALDALIDFGRPKAVMLAVLIDRGHRELPIHADVIGKTVPTDAHEVIKVKLAETDGEDEVLIMEK